MARILSITRGSFVVKKMNEQIQPSIITLDGLDLPDEGALVVNFNVNDMEKSSIIQCFNDVNHIYAFGHDPEQSAFSLTYLVYLGKACMKDDTGGFQAGDALSSIVQSYNNIKVSKGSTATVSCGHGVSYLGIVLSANVAVHDPELNLVSVTIAGKIVEGGQ